MTKKELRQLYYLNREIMNDTEELLDLKFERKCSGDSRWGKRQEKMIAVREKEIVEKIRRCQGLKNKIRTYINSIDDSFVRQIFQYRFIKCLPWRNVAYMVGGGNTPDSVRKIVDRYLNK